MEISECEKWLDEVQKLILKHKKVSEDTGCDFNIFQVLKISSSEVRLHSNLIGSLLNPIGSHGQGDKYLKLFLKNFSIEGFDTESAFVEVEKYIGAVDFEAHTGGRVDISINDKNGKQIYIENKIYAGDQQGQILRYYNNNEKAELLYLTLDGREATTYSTLDKISIGNYRCISYENDILAWLIECRKESANKNSLIEILSQYINLIEVLTNRVESKPMNSELRELIQKNSDLIKCIEICTLELDAMVNEVHIRFKKALDDHFSSVEPINFNEYKIKPVWGEDGDGLHFGYKAFLGEKSVSNDPKLDRIKSTLRDIDDNFKSGGSWLGWVNPSEFKRYEKFRSRSKDVLIGYYNNNQLLQNLSDSIINQEKRVSLQLINELKSN